MTHTGGGLQFAFPVLLDKDFYRCDDSDPEEHASSFVPVRSESFNDFSQWIAVLDAEKSSPKYLSLIKTLIFDVAKFRDLETQRSSSEVMESSFFRGVEPYHTFVTSLSILLRRHWNSWKSASVAGAPEMKNLLESCLSTSLCDLSQDRDRDESDGLSLWVKIWRIGLELSLPGSLSNEEESTEKRDANIILLQNIFQSLLLNFPEKITREGYLEWWLSFPFLCSEYEAITRLGSEDKHTEQLLEILSKDLDTRCLGEPSNHTDHKCMITNSPTLGKCCSSSVSDFTSSHDLLPSSIKGMWSVLLGMRSVALHRNDSNSIQTLGEGAMKVATSLELQYLLPLFSTNYSGATHYAPTWFSAKSWNDLSFPYEKEYFRQNDTEKGIFSFTNEAICDVCRGDYREIFSTAVYIVLGLLPRYTEPRRRDLLSSPFYETFIARMMLLVDAYEVNADSQSTATETDPHTRLEVKDAVTEFAKLMEKKGQLMISKSLINLEKAKDEKK